MTFDPKKVMSSIKGKDYLEVKWRIVWFRDQMPAGRIITEVVHFEPPIVRAGIYDGDGNIIASGHAQAVSEGRTVWTGREIEKAETAAIGRALAHAGFGTQFTGEDEGEFLADSPVEKQDAPSATWAKEYIDAVMASTDKITAKSHAISWLNLVHPKTVPHIKMLMPAYSEKRDAGMEPELAAQAIQTLNV